MHSDKRQAKLTVSWVSHQNPFDSSEGQCGAALVDLLSRFFLLFVIGEEGIILSLFLWNSNNSEEKVASRC